MVSPLTYTVWGRCSDPKTRWSILDAGLSQEKARERMTVGNTDAQRYGTSMIYLTLPTGERPAVLASGGVYGRNTPASPGGQTVK